MRWTWFGLFFLVAVAAASSVAHAQPNEAFRLDRFEFAPTPDDGLALQLPSTLGHLRASVVVGFDYANEPLLVMADNVDDEGAIVKHRMRGTLLAALGLTDYLELHLRIPVVLYQAGDEPTIGTVMFQDPDAAGLADLGVGASARILGEHDDVFQLGAGVEFRVPVGSNGALATDQGAGFGGTLNAALVTDAVTLAVALGGAYRASRDYVTSSIGPEVLFTGGLHGHATEQIDLMLEVAGSTTPRAKNDPTAAELFAGLRHTSEAGVFAQLGAGLGLTDAVGVPRVRALVALGYAPPAVYDQDEDGLLDPDDKCPTDPEDKDGFEDEDGCPDPDNDKDGVLDAPDQCPLEPEDEDEFKDEDGCPDPDNDEDGILDANDSCPIDPEDRDSFEDTDGCPDPDNDQDGIPDESDQCPMEPEDKDGFGDEDGCPETDNDQDGILDEVDKCPVDPEDKDNFEDADGCPDPDNDADGVLDGSDGCPMDPEDKDGFEDEDGCPDPDNDQDTVLDGVDKCPMDPGPVNNDGCPLAKIEKKQIRIYQRIEFAYNKARIQTQSLPVVEEVRRILAENPEITGLRIEGHTDSRGSERFNQRLSDRRAHAVMMWLVDHGIAAERLSAEGLGEIRPIVPNDSAENRQTNRRVEFHIVGGGVREGASSEEP